MQVTKITINKELLEIPNGTKTLHYAVKEPIWKDNFQDFDSTRQINYLVNVNDRHLFDVLAKIEQEDIETMEYKWKMEFMTYKAPIIRQQVRDDIKRLKWYKRLFNKF